jgi:hypothetical protein
MLLQGPHHRTSQTHSTPKSSKAKTKAKKDGEPNIEENSATSSVEIVDEILSGQPVTRAQESEDLEDKNKTNCPKTPLERGFVPPYTGMETPDASGEDPTTGEEHPRKSESGEVPEPDVESGVESNTSEEDTADREMSPRQEGPKPFQLNLNKILTAAMKKGTPICGLRNDLEQDLGLDPGLMPTSPEGVHLTPISPLDQVPENVFGQQLAEEEIARRLKKQREDDVPTATHAEPDSTHNKVVFETKK